MSATLLTALLCLAPAGDTVAIVLDNSGSMRNGMSGIRGSRMDAAKAALEVVLRETPPETDVGVLLLNGRDKWVVPLGGDREQAIAAVKQLRAAGGTPLGASMKDAADALMEKRKQSPAGDYRLLIVSDGEANDQNLVDAYLPQIQARGLGVDVIGVDMDGEHSLATQVALYRRADDADSLTKAISEVVQGETTAGGGDTGESDFELLEGFPADVAAASLRALTNPPNAPIEKPQRGGFFGGGGNAGGGGGGGFSFLTLMVMALVAFGFINALFGQRRASR